jgi:hypothetical protein
MWRRFCKKHKKENTMPETFYHVTTPENAALILKQGLKPKIGPRSAITNEKHKAVYLCKEKDIPYWQIILDMPVILTVTYLEEDDTDFFGYAGYDEYIYRKSIPAENIKEACIETNTAGAMKRLCAGYISLISNLCELCARYYYYKDTTDMTRLNKDDKEYMTSLYESIEQQTNFLNYLLPRLDYSTITKQEIKKIIKNQGDDGEYTLCDIYFDTDKTLLEMLSEYPKDELSDGLVKVQKIITEKLEDCLHINTGGFCG